MTSSYEATEDENTCLFETEVTGTSLYIMSMSGKSVTVSVCDITEQF